MRRLAWLIFFLILPAYGASDFYETFDFKNCLHWYIDNEPHGVELSKEPKEYIAALELANRHPYSWHKIESWYELEKMPETGKNKLVSVYSASAGHSKNNYVQKFGACYGNLSVGITCLPKQNFPLTGATYRAIKSKGILTTLACVAGCKTGAPAYIYYMGYENMEGERNIEHETAKKRFIKVCGGSL
jgi:hypothetical protein